MTKNKPGSQIQHILCPSDLSEKSQKALGFAARLAETLDASLTACHCAPASWFTEESQLPDEKRESIRDTIKERVAACQDGHSTLTWKSLIVENSFDPALDILKVARDADVDLIVMKARPGVLSAFRFGSIVERIVERSPCPTLLLPSRFLGDHNPAKETLEFRRVLFDYDFSEATDDLFRVATTLARDCHSELQVLSVMDPPTLRGPELACHPSSRTSVQTTVRRKLDEVLHAEGKSVMEVPTVVEWGKHAETVLSYAREHDIDLICTALPAAHHYYEKLYSAYLGSLLKSAGCPILVKQSVDPDNIRNFPL